MLTGQKGKGLENKGFFDSPYLPSLPWGLSRVWSQETDFYPFLKQSRAEVCCPRKPNLQFMLLLGLREVAIAVSLHIQKPPQPKWKHPVGRGYTEQLVTASNSSQVSSAWECTHSSTSIWFLPSKQKDLLQLPSLTFPLHEKSASSWQTFPFPNQKLPPVMGARCSYVHCYHERGSYSPSILFLKNLLTKV